MADVCRTLNEHCSLHLIAAIYDVDMGRSLSVSGDASEQTSNRIHIANMSQRVSECFLALTDDKELGDSRM
jgi:hypothetical protein